MSNHRRPTGFGLVIIAAIVLAGCAGKSNPEDFVERTWERPQTASQVLEDHAPQVENAQPPRPHSRAWNRLRREEARERAERRQRRADREEERNRIEYEEALEDNGPLPDRNEGCRGADFRKECKRSTH